MNQAPHAGPILLAGMVIGYLLLLATNPVRSSLRDGWRCLNRYKTIFLLPAGFALAHAGFTLWVHFYESWAIPNGTPTIAAWNGWQPPAWTTVLTDSLLPAAESMSSIFNCIVTTFPLSALFAVAFLCNLGGSQAVLFAALRRRTGRLAGLGLHAGMLVCAVAAVGKPVLFGGLPRLNTYFGEVLLLRMGEALNWLSFLFEYLLGVGIQIYLVLLSFAWMRGTTFDAPALRRFALRRFAFVVKWAVVVMAISSAGINVPLILASFQVPVGHGDLTALVGLTRWLLAGVLTIFCSVQILLIFHNESLRRALADHARLWRRNGWFLAWLMVIAGLHFFVLAITNALLPRALGAWTWPGILWTTALYPVAWSVLAAWLLASWVCLFRRCERNQPGAAELVRF